MMKEKTFSKIHKVDSKEKIIGFDKEKTLSDELEKWFNKWHRKVVTGRCLIELKQRDKQFIKEILEDLFGGSKRPSDNEMMEIIKQKAGGLVDE